MNLDLLALSIRDSKYAEEIVGPDDEGRKQRLRTINLFLHPDRWPDVNDRETANKAFAQLQELLHAEAKAGSSTFEITTRKRTYHINGLAFKGTVANLYNATYEREGSVKKGLLKLPRSPKDNDLITAEAKALKTIWDSEDERRVFFPRYEESFKHRDKGTGIDRKALVLRKLSGFVSLADVLKTYPEGLDPRDLAWIWRRCLAGIGMLDEVGFVHGSICPEHILIHPLMHGVILCGMTTAVESGEKVRFLGTNPSRPALVAPEIFAKGATSTATDIYMLSMTMLGALHQNAPKQFRTFVRGCVFERMTTRPQDPMRLLKEFDELLDRLYERKFRPFPPLP